MKTPGILWLLPLIFQSVVSQTTSRKFPSNFQWGIGTSSYQIEGAWNEGGKGESIWDHMTHNSPNKIVDKSNGDITCDSYHNWRRDIEMVRELGVSIYRFSISWARVLANGHVSAVNNEGINYYNYLIDGLLSYNITLMVTIYHWELPQSLQLIGGWTNEKLIDYYKDFARVLFDNFGDRVKIWSTFNEPFYICQGYETGFMAPGVNFPGIAGYLCGHTILKAHAEVVHMYRDQYQAKTKSGRIGITLDSTWHEPKTNSTDDREASERALQFYLGWFAHPIFKGNYPPVMIERIGELSLQQGFTGSRLPMFTQDEIARIYNTSDFFSICSYTSNLVTKSNGSNEYRIPSFSHDLGIEESFNADWPASGSVWLRVYPKGLYNLLKWIEREYENPSVIVTESGVSDRGETNDTSRITYFYSYLEAVLDAIEEGGNIEGFIAWSLMDSFEWAAGYQDKFGLYYVDFDDPNRTRYAKASAKAFARISQTNEINWNYWPDPEIVLPENENNSNMAAILSETMIFSIFCLIFGYFLQ